MGIFVPPAALTSVCVVSTSAQAPAQHPVFTGGPGSVLAAQAKAGLGPGPVSVTGALLPAAGPGLGFPQPRSGPEASSLSLPRQRVVPSRGGVWL